MSKWYSPQQLLSYDRIVHMCIGERSIGKSYAFKKYPIDKFLKDGKKFIYLRRYKPELKKLGTYFDDIAEIYPTHNFTVKGWKLFCDGKLMGQAIPLSMWQSEKGTNYPEYDTIIFDEFIREKDKSGYMPNEVSAFLNICHTVFRKRKGVRAFCLSNSVTEVNPYFLEFNIQLEKNKRFNFSGDKEFKNFVVVENTNGFYTPGYEEMSDFEKMISHMEYGKMALNNEFTNDTKDFLKSKSKESKFQFTIIYKGRHMGIWADAGKGELYVSKSHDPKTKKVFPMSLDDQQENMNYEVGWKDNYHLLKLVTAFKKGYLRFDNQVIKTHCYEMFKKMNIF